MNSAHAAHFAQFFETDEALIEAACSYLRDAIDANCTGVALTTMQHRERIETRLNSMGLAPAALAAAYRYITLDAHRALDSFMIDGCPDRQRFHHSMGQLIRQAAARGQPVCVFSEVVPLLAAAGRRRCAVEVEDLWNELTRLYSFTLCCAYPLATFENDENTRARLCALHQPGVQSCI
ncbi:MEDS domain-containing protein [Steroidobacter denitrificans]|nr:MEDS domain-containing protein [Steroidobacter denitrificans]